MPTLTKILQEAGYSQAYTNEWLHQLIGDWQAIADLAFADLVLMIPDGDDFIVGAHARPATASTLVERDLIGEYVSIVAPEIIHSVRGAYFTGEIAQYTRDLVKHKFVPVNLGSSGLSEGLTAAIQGSGNVLKSGMHPLVAGNSANGVEPVAENNGAKPKSLQHPIAVIHVISAVFPNLSPTQLYQNYAEMSDVLLEMITTGEFPMEGTPSSYRHGVPRVSDGVISMDIDGEVVYASPNSVSHFRRLGIDPPLVGVVLAEAVSELIENNEVPDEQLPLVLMGRAAWVSEFKSHGVVISMRALPLKLNGERLGAILLTRDVSELRRQEAKLQSKDAAIREINHRVKNNLQTVAALLRLQVRRVHNEEARDALMQAQRRVEMIAIVHEGLSQTVDEIVEFDQVFASLMRAIRDVAVLDQEVVFEFNGSFGRVRAEQATALAVVINEVISNAVEHGVPHGGHIRLDAVREENQLTLTVSDDGLGISDGKLGGGLGTQIVQTLVQTELNGSIEWKNRESGGTQVIAKMYLQQ